MLTARAVGKAATSRASPRIAPAFGSLPIRNLSTTPAHRPSLSMLHSAVQKHEQQNAAAKKIASPNYFSSSPPTPPTSSRALGTHARNGSSRDPLLAATQSEMNEIRGVQMQRAPQYGIKRAANGLAKAMSGSFEDDPGSQQRPIFVKNSPNKRGKVQLTQTDFVDENDFDSDIELDIEEPGPKYPNLGRSAPSPSRPVVYPTLPRQQQAQTGHNMDLYDTGELPATMAAPKSSVPMPWSSSPAEHLAPSNKPSLDGFRYQSAGATGALRHHSPPKQSNQAFTYGSTNTQRAQNGPPPPQPQTKPAAKRRTIPWARNVEEEPETTWVKMFNTKSVSATAPNATPFRKADKGPKFPWNTTASAVKEQQRQHREDNKRYIKNNEADEDAKTMAKMKKAREQPAKVFLSEEQQLILALVTEQKKSVFFTGSAGTGKSVLMREIISTSRTKYSREPDRLAVTASTGLAACNIGGVTLHSFAGFGLGKEDVPELVRKIKKNQKAKHRWLRTKVLIVDEISMVDGDMFDKLEAIARQIRNNGRPFGGIQLVVTGDFFQLPPVPGYGQVAKFAFDAATWKTSIEHTIALHHVFRQKDPVFAGMLNEMREGRLQQSSINAFHNLSRPLGEEHDIEATELFPTRNEVDIANNSRLANLQGEVYVFEGKDGGTITDPQQREKVLSNTMAPAMITLKKGAQVMLIKNVDATLVNGSIGRVMGFMDENKFDGYVKRDLENAALNNEGTFASSPVHSTANKAPLADSMYGGARPGGMVHGSSTREWPVVRFVIADGTSRDFLCMPEMYKNELPNGEVQASRLQIPLILAWALSIHKAQGQTLERVKVDLGKVFEKGQAYVALSRATSMAGLQVLRFDPKKVNAHERVRHFYANLSRVEMVEKNQRRMASLDAENKKRKAGAVSADDYERDFVGGGWD